MADIPAPQNTEEKATHPIHIWVTQHVAQVLIGLIITSLFSVAGVALNLYVNSRFLPFDEADKLIRIDVKALQDKSDKTDSDHEKIIILEQTIKPLKEDVSEIKADTKDIKNYLIKQNGIYKQTSTQ